MPTSVASVHTPGSKVLAVFNYTGGAQRFVVPTGVKEVAVVARGASGGQLGGLGDEFLVRRLGLIVLKGKTTPTVVYEVLAEKSDLAQSRMTAESVARYEEAFDHFLARRFAQAEAGFQACEKDYPEDYCVKNYLQASREFITNPPPLDWDGRIVMTTK